jgi:hypothetical protein
MTSVPVDCSIIDDFTFYRKPIGVKCLIIKSEIVSCTVGE